MTKVEIFSAEVCPFAQRTRIALLEKDVSHSLQEIDLSAKPDWFLAISPYAKVPVVRHDGHVVYESAIINEYLEEIFPEPALLPRDPYRRAMARVWIDFANVKLLPAFYRLLLSQERAKQAGLAEEFTAHLRSLENGMRELSDGPFWLGKDVTLVDLSLYPWFERLPALAHYRDVDLPEDCARLTAWSATMAARPSVRATAHDTAFHIAAYAHYADGTTQSITADEMRASA